MNMRMIAACAMGALLGSAVILAEASPSAPDYDDLVRANCIGDGQQPYNPTWDDEWHNPYPNTNWWCCWASMSGANQVDEYVRKNPNGTIRTSSQGACNLAP